jgi:hypothetical protein
MYSLDKSLTAVLSGALANAAADEISEARITNFIVKLFNDKPCTRVNKTKMSE